MIEMTLTFPRSAEEEMTTALILEGFEEFEVVDDDLADSLKPEEKNWDIYERSGIPSGQISIRVFMEDTQAAGLAERISRHLHLSFTTSIREVRPSDYANDWKQYFHTIDISDTLRVVPVWEPAQESDLRIDPGTAFGTGSHETTRMCLEMIDRLQSPAFAPLMIRKALDIGTGSGILAIALAKRYGTTVDAYEIDPLARKSAAENIALNHVKDLVHLHAGDFSKDVLGKYHLIVSNIYAETLIDYMRDFKRHLTPDGMLLLSGIISSKAAAVGAACEACGLSVLKKSECNGWVMLLAIARAAVDGEV